jgi:hypothetical protein
MANKSIVIFAYSRAQLLKETIDSIAGAADSENWKKILVCQRGHDDVFEVVSQNRALFDLVVLTSPQYESTLANINYNRLLGTNLGFDIFHADLVLGIEEDTKISYDALQFIDRVFQKYRNNRFFRGINLGSIEEKTQENLLTYSRIRFGLHGQAGVITKKTWKKINFSKLRANMSLEGWDSYIEFKTKSGFMVTPNASRSLDRGWSGTYAPDNPDHPHYVAMRESFVGSFSKLDSNFTHVSLKHRWRSDATVFKFRHQLLFFIRGSRFGAIIARFLKKLRLPRFKIQVID